MTKNIKTQVRTTMSQEKLIALAIISIENQHLNKLKYDDFIEEFVSKKCKVVFFELENANSNYKTL